ncbi:MAG: hypothetical protein HOE76_06160 [Euryarchaeota archaeon]|jgi:hypothetical protein|nr:hypothetical protein [Euryarchaeota archaeon]MBT4982880.1 hypothetical protein [Euryarchaeota archaeon]MBT5184243.1 hypothetical protein [Euryarchaeota archaeon]
MSNLPSRPQRPTGKQNLSARIGNLSANAILAPPVTMGTVGQAPVNAVNSGMQKFAQLILFAIAMIAIWAGLLSIAFGGDEQTQMNFLVLGIGGILSGVLAISLVEFQVRKGGNELQNVHDYMLGVAFFFLAVGTLWGTRWLIGFLAGQEVHWLIPEGTDPLDSGWIPSANAIYLQMAATLALALAQTFYLMRLKGVTTFGWSVTTFTPLVVALIGSSIWMEWSDNIVSWELGIAMISLASLSMWLSLRANSGIIFSVVAVTSGLLPMLYEYNNEDVGSGGALSLLVFIIAVQGILAADRRLRQDLMQWTSALLVGEVVLAMILARDADFELILGPIRQSELGSLEPYLTLQVGLWMTVLVAYFPATLKRRIPYMPIGLAGSLFIISSSAGLIPWIVTLVMLPYLLVISKVTRQWVANCTMIATGFSFFIQSHWMGGFEPGWLEATILIVVLASGEVGRQKGHLSDWAHFVTLGLLVISKSVLFGDDPYVPWAIFIYAVVSSYMMMVKSEANGSKQDAFEASSATAGSMVIAVILSLFDRLEVPLPSNIAENLEGFNVTLALVGLIVYASMRKFRTIELDLGVMFNWAEGKRKSMMPVFDTTTNSWVVDNGGASSEPADYSWGPLGRMSLIGPMILFTVALTAVGPTNLAENIIWTLLLIIPIGIIVKEVLDEERASSTGRMIATFTMIAVAAPMALSLNLARGETDGLIYSTILFDLMLLAGPLGVSVLLSKKGLNDDSLNRTADIATLMGLLVLGLFDTSGGLLFLTMYILVFSRAVKHRVNLVLCIAPIAILLFGFDSYGDRFVSDGAIVGDILSKLDIISYDPSEITILGLSRFSFFVMATTSLIILARGVLDRQYGLDAGAIEAPMTVPAFWLTLGMFGVLPEASWLLLTMTILVTIYAWLVGRIEIIPWIPTLALISFLIGFTNDSNFSHFDGGDVFAHSLLGTGLFALTLNQLSSKGWLYKYADEAIDDQLATATIFNLVTIQNRERLTSVLRIWTIVGLTFSWTAFKGIGTMIGAIWATYDTFVNGQKYAILAMPLLHAFAVWNMLEQFEQNGNVQDALVGTVLILSGLLFTLIASKAEIAWNWEIFDWSHESEYYGWIDRVGQLGITYFLIGITWAIGEADQEGMLWAIWAVFLSGVAIQGFRDETETPWRRGIGSIGCIFALFMLSFTFETDLYQSINWMFMGVVALGFGFAYISRMGEVSTLYDQSYTDAKDAIQIDSNDGDKYVTIPEPITEETEEIEEVNEETVEDEDDLSEDELEQVLDEVGEDEDTHTDGEPAPQLQTPLHYNYDLQLDQTVLHAIQSSLAATPHAGFKPVVSIAKNGNLKIDFIPL